MRLRDPEGVNFAVSVLCPYCDGHGFHQADDRRYECTTCDKTGVVPHPGTLGRRTLSHSSIGTQLACERKYGYSYVENLEPISRKESLAMGDAFHRGLEAGVPSAAGDVLREAQPFENTEVQVAIVESAVELYLLTYGERDPVNIIGQQAFGATREFDWRVRVRNPRTGYYSRRFDLVGRADGLIDFGDRFTLEEDKLVGKLDPVQIRLLPLDRQVGLNAYGIWRATGKPVTEIRYRFVKKPQIKQGGQTVKEFCARIRADYKARPDFYAPTEQKLFRSSDDLLALEAEVWEWAHRRADIERRATFARNTSSCGDYGGCPFIPLCIGDPDARALYQPKERR